MGLLNFLMELNIWHFLVLKIKMQFLTELKYLTGLKSGITDTFCPSYGNREIDSHDDLALEETLTLHNAIIFIKSVFYKNQNHYYFK